MKKLILLASVALALAFAGSCKKSGSSTTNNNTTTPTPTVDFVSIGSFTFWGKNATQVQTKVSVDTFLYYSRVLGIADTSMWVYHEVRKAKSYNIASITDTDKDCVIQVNWGTTPSSPKVHIDAGTYKLEKVSGKWVSTLTGGTGISSTTSKRINNISFRLTWPN